MIGFARLSGFTTLPENFNWPFLSRNVQEFWSRWHISLGVWIKHYVFTPLSKKCLYLGRGQYLNLMLSTAVILTFLIVGGWHGPTSNFLVFGLLHGLAVVVTNGWRAYLNKSLGKDRLAALDENRWARTIATLLCFHYLCFTILLLNNSVGNLILGFGTYFMS